MSDETTTEKLCDLLRDAAEGDETVIDVIRDTIGEGDKATPRTTVVVHRRKCQAEPPFAPERSESLARNHTFHDAEGFAAYLAKYGTDDTVVLADVKLGRMHAVLNEKTETGFEIVSLAPPLDPRFAPWDELLGRSVAIKDFAAFVMENRRTVINPEVRPLVLLLRQVQASIKTEIQQGIGSGAINGMMVTTKIQGKDTTEPVDLPETITIRTPLFVNTPEMEIEIDLLVMADDNRGVGVRPSASMVLEAKTKAFLDMCKTVDSVEQATVALGTVA